MSDQTAQAPPSFDIKLYDLHAASVQELRAMLTRVADAIDPELLRGPLAMLTHELAANALQALYKLAFYRFLLTELGLEDLDYEGWLQIFRMELAEHRAENFARVCRERDLFIRVKGTLMEDGYLVEVENPGEPAKEELARLRSVIGQAFGPEIFEQMLARSSELDDRPVWDAGVGLPLVIVTLRGLGIPPGNLRVVAGHGRTVASFLLPRTLFRGDRPFPAAVFPGREEEGLLLGIYGAIPLGLARFDSQGRVVAVSRGLLEMLGLPDGDPGKVGELIPRKFFTDLFTGPQSIRLVGRFENYRIHLIPGAGTERLFNISGHLAAPDRVDTIWQEVRLQGQTGRLGEGSIGDNLNLQRIIEPYIPPSVLQMAREAVSLGTNRLNDAVLEMTVLFADLEGFTHKAEHLEPHRVMELLNLSLGVCVRAIEMHGGTVDKFMGDAVMALFPKPVDAVAAAVEIQNQFRHLNRFRKNANEDPINLRIGINTGQVIMGNIGTPRRMDWTAIGDVVNTASRVEKQAPRGGVLVGEAVYERIQDAVTYSDIRNVRVKGKDDDLRLYAIETVRFQREGEVVTLRLLGEGDDDDLL